MSGRARVAFSVVIAGAGIVLIAASIPAAAGRSLSACAGPVIVGVALLAAAVLVSRRQVAQLGAVRREAKRGIRQIEMVLELEATLSANRLPVGGANGGCPNCGAPPGPHCVCRKRSSPGRDRDA